MNITSWGEGVSIHPRLGSNPEWWAAVPPDIAPDLLEKAVSDEGSKIPALVKNVKRIYDATSSYKGTQLIFTDRAQAGGIDVNVNNVIREKLIDAGIREEEIVIMPHADAGMVPVLDENGKQVLEDEVDVDGNVTMVKLYQTKQDEVSDKVRSGVYRVMLGSTERGGTGLNLQDRVSGIHHMDAPWTSTGLEQRLGRGLRQGNRIEALAEEANAELLPMENIIYIV